MSENETQMVELHYCLCGLYFRRADMLKAHIEICCEGEWDKHYHKEITRKEWWDLGV